MPEEQREQVTRVVIYQSQRAEELADLDGRRQPSMGGTSRMNREVQVRICERLGVKFPGPTRPRGAIPRGYSPGTIGLCDGKLWRVQRITS